MRKAAFLGVMVLLVAVLVVVLANSSVTKHGVKMGPKSAEACNKDIPGECLPRLGYLDTRDTMWTPELLDGKVVMVNFWATWCAPCKEEVPALTAAYKKYADKGFVLLGVLVDSDAVTDEQLASFARQYNLDYPVVRIDQDIFSAFAEPGALPTTFVYDRTGMLRHKKLGMLSHAEIERVLDKLFAE